MKWNPIVPLAAMTGMVAILLGSTGCNHSERSVGEAADALRATFEDHDHERPAHMPISFPAAIEELERRHEQCRRAWCVAGPPPAAEPFQELLEITGWLPRLAADSDLQEAQWWSLRESIQAVEGAYRALALRMERGPSVELAAGFDQAAAAFPRLRQSAEEHRELFEVTPRAESETAPETLPPEVGP